MKEQISETQFMDRFIDMNRNDNFSYDGKRALFEYLEQYEEDTDTEVEMDIIALCCEYTEYEDIKEFLNAYSNTIKIDRKDFEKDEEEEYNKAVMEELEEHTTVIRIENSEGFIIQDF